MPPEQVSQQGSMANVRMGWLGAQTACVTILQQLSLQSLPGEVRRALPPLPHPPAPVLSGDAHFRAPRPGSRPCSRTIKRADGSRATTLTSWTGAAGISQMLADEGRDGLLEGLPRFPALLLGQSVELIDSLLCGFGAERHASPSPVYHWWTMSFSSVQLRLGRWLAALEPAACARGVDVLRRGAVPWTSTADRNH